MKSICETHICTGCAACYNSCPANAIKMEPDEKGFLHPAIDVECCVDCGLCKKVCPQVNGVRLNEQGSIYAALAKDDEIRNASSSGGLFSLLAANVLRKGGVVFGAALQPNMSVEHIMIEDVSQIWRLRGSKYVQSSIGDSYKHAALQLKTGRQVLFSGTPCQIAGLYAYLGETQANLLTVDILCHGVPSPKAFTKFIKRKEEKAGSEIIRVSFREKDPGWKSFSTKLVYKNSAEETDNSFYWFFVKDYLQRENCSACKYAKTERIGDITLGDFWGYRESGPEHIEDDDRGISFVSINTVAGKAAFRRVKHSIAFTKRSIEDAAKGNAILTRPFDKNKDSSAFWEDFSRLEWEKLAEKYGIPSAKKESIISAADRAYYNTPFRKRHRRHLLYCAKKSMLSHLGRKNS